jgi:transcriptional regulator with XRE-family HTH domain
MDQVTQDVGRQVRRLRKSRGLTLAQLADRAGCTSSYLSSVERGSTTPTLSAMSGLAAALRIDLAGFFVTPPPSEVHVYRASEQQRLRISAQARQTYTILTGTRLDPSFTGLLEELTPRLEPSTQAFSYFGERFVLLLEGNVELALGSELLRLEPGDTVHYSSHPDHTLRVTSPTDAFMLWLVTPALL